MELIDLLKKLAEKYPEKWWTKTFDGVPDFYFCASNDDHCVVRRIDGELDCSTEDMDAILTEHGLVMWVKPFGWHRVETWGGEFASRPDDLVYQKRDDTFPTKREATLATFQAALEYLTKDKP